LEKQKDKTQGDFDPAHFTWAHDIFFYQEISGVLGSSCLDVQRLFAPPYWDLAFVFVGHWKNIGKTKSPINQEIFVICYYYFYLRG
jgi:hypothetical protein